MSSVYIGKKRIQQHTDGSEIQSDVYEAIVLWDGSLSRISIHEANAQPLVGMSMMYGYKITIENIDGGNVTIEPL